MTASAELVEYLARRLVEHEDQVSVEEIEEAGTLVIRLRVAPEDLGRVIGRGGRIARALRTLRASRRCARRPARHARDRRVMETKPTS